MPVKRYKGAKAKADELFSKIIRAQGRCEAEGWAERNCSNQLQCAHIVTRGRSATRTDTRNAFCLCFSHHRWFHDYPRSFSHFISDTWAAGYYDGVEARSRRATKVNWEERVEFLKPIYEGKLSLKEARELEE
jgi:hypothetical protein